MLKLIFPSSFDNSFKAHSSALWIFYLVTAMTLARSLAHILLSDGGAQSIATIPLHRFTPDGADTVVAVFALWGQSQLLLGLVMLLAALCYRSMVPLLFVITLLEYLGRIAIGLSKNLVTEGVPPGAPGNIVLILVGVVALTIIALSARGKT